jgi:protein MPE1
MKDAQRVTFDGTDISVWELKREIIIIMKLGDGKDFDLALYKDNTDEGNASQKNHRLVIKHANSPVEYAEDTERIPQSSLVLARRLPAKIPGRGKANKYVDGKPPVEARSTTNNPTMKKASKAIDVNAAQTEEERAAAVLRLGEEQWKLDQQEMATAQRVPMTFNKNAPKKANIPEGEPPHGYICYRCGKKGKIDPLNAF